MVSFVKFDVEFFVVFVYKGELCKEFDEVWNKLVDCMYFMVFFIY